MQEITHTDMLLPLLSSDSSVWIYKFNPSNCSLSNRTKPVVETMAKEKQRSVYRIDIINHKDISLLCAEKTGIEHESPQLLVIQQGKLVAHVSHMHISSERLGQR